MTANTTASTLSVALKLGCDKWVHASRGGFTAKVTTLDEHSVPSRLTKPDSSITPTAPIDHSFVEGTNSSANTA